MVNYRKPHQYEIGQTYPFKGGFCIPKKINEDSTLLFKYSFPCRSCGATISYEANNKQPPYKKDPICATCKQKQYVHKKQNLLSIRYLVPGYSTYLRDKIRFTVINRIKVPDPTDKWFILVRLDYKCPKCGRTWSKYRAGKLINIISHLNINCACKDHRVKEFKTFTTFNAMQVGKYYKFHNAEIYVVSRINEKAFHLKIIRHCNKCKSRFTINGIYKGFLPLYLNICYRCRRYKNNPKNFAEGTYVRLNEPRDIVYQVTKKTDNYTLVDLKDKCFRCSYPIYKSKRIGRNSILSKTTLPNYLCKECIELKRRRNTYKKFIEYLKQTLSNIGGILVAITHKNYINTTFSLKRPCSCCGTFIETEHNRNILNPYRQLEFTNTLVCDRCKAFGDLDYTFSRTKGFHYQIKNCNIKYIESVDTKHKFVYKSNCKWCTKIIKETKILAKATLRFTDTCPICQYLIKEKGKSRCRVCGKEYIKYNSSRILCHRKACHDKQQALTKRDKLIKNPPNIKKINLEKRLSKYKFKLLDMSNITNKNKSKRINIKCSNGHELFITEARLKERQFTCPVCVDTKLDPAIKKDLKNIYDAKTRLLFNKEFRKYSLDVYFPDYKFGIVFIKPDNRSKRFTNKLKLDLFNKQLSKEKVDYCIIFESEYFKYRSHYINYLNNILGLNKPLELDFIDEVSLKEAQEFRNKVIPFNTTSSTGNYLGIYKKDLIGLIEYSESSELLGVTISIRDITIKTGISINNMYNLIYNYLTSFYVDSGYKDIIVRYIENTNLPDKLIEYSNFVRNTDKTYSLYLVYQEDVILQTSYKTLTKKHVWLNGETIYESRYNC